MMIAQTTAALSRLKPIWSDTNIYLADAGTHLIQGRVPGLSGRASDFGGREGRTP